MFYWCHIFVSVCCHMSRAVNFAALRKAVLRQSCGVGQCEVCSVTYPCRHCIVLYAAYFEHGCEAVMPYKYGVVCGSENCY